MGLNPFFLPGISQHITPFYSDTLSEVQLFLSLLNLQSMGFGVRLVWV